MKFRKTIEIGVMLFGKAPFLPKLQVGQHITVDGNRGRWVGLTKCGTVLIVWPNTCGRARVDSSIRILKTMIRMERI